MVTDSIALLEALVAETRASRERLDDDIAKMELALRNLRNDRAALRDEEAVLISALQRRVSSAPTLDIDVESAQVEAKVDDEDDVAVEEDDWTTLARTRAVEVAVGELSLAKGFATPAEIEALLRSRGRDDIRDHIGAALAYLNRSDKVHRRARAEWVTGPVF